jgi:hypothetical protein
MNEQPSLTAGQNRWNVIADAFYWILISLCHLLKLLHVNQREAWALPFTS